jgi:hypothetical protein
MYLSRSREYYADDFSGQETGNPNALSLALVKIAYGITKVPLSEQSKRLMGGTRLMGISDFKMARGTGLAYGAVNKQASVPQPPAQPAYAAASYAPPLQTIQGYPQRQDLHQAYGQPQYPQQAYGQPQYPQQAAYAAPDAGAYYAPPAAATSHAVTMDGVAKIEKVFLFDLFNPWATVCELQSTHPLTGKRIRAMCDLSRKQGKQPLFAFEKVDAEGRALDMGRLYGGFFFEVGVYYAHYILAAILVVCGVACALAGNTALSIQFFASIVAAIGLGLVLRSAYRFPGVGSAKPTTVLALMSDPYASPLRGRPVTLVGSVIGRADAGNRISEDMTLEDAEGGRVMLNYESPFGFFGNWWFAAYRTGQLIGQQVQAVGWFRRSTYHVVDLKMIHAADGRKFSSWTGIWAKIGPILLLLLGCGLVAYVSTLSF